MKKLIEQFRSRVGQVAILIDPEKNQDEVKLKDFLNKVAISCIDYIFIGGSTVTQEEFERTIKLVKENSTIPVVIFPGSSDQLSNKADGILYLSLLSGRNPDFLIGHHVRSAQRLHEMDIEVIPTAYLLIDGGTKSSVAYISQTTPIPRDQYSIVRNTALAGKLQGKQIVFLDAGSGAYLPVPKEMIEELKDIGCPIIVGGGLSSIAQLISARNAGANVLVVGNKLEEDIDFLLDLRSFVKDAHC